jgi:hypothetical protein
MPNKKDNLSQQEQPAVYKKAQQSFLKKFLCAERSTFVIMCCNATMPISIPLQEMVKQQPP